MKRLLSLLCLLVLMLTLFGCADQPHEGMLVEVIDVGQSDCTLITVDDAALMIDTATVTQRAAGQAALRRQNISRIEYLLLTHLHEDHVGNARMLLETYTVGALLLPPIENSELDLRLLTEAAERRGVPIHILQNGDMFALSGATVEVLQAGGDSEDPNDASAVVTVTFGKTRFLFTGDREEAGEARLLASVPPEKLQSDVLKAGHHGSQNATGKALLTAVAPCHVAFSCGESNGYGFPHTAVLKRLAEIGVEWHRTDKEGSLCYFSDGECVRYIE